MLVALGWIQTLDVLIGPTNDASWLFKGRQSSIDDTRTTLQ